MINSYSKHLKYKLKYLNLKKKLLGGATLQPEDASEQQDDESEQHKTPKPPSNPISNKDNVFHRKTILEAYSSLTDKFITEQKTLETNLKKFNKAIESADELFTDSAAKLVEESFKNPETIPEIDDELQALQSRLDISIEQANNNINSVQEKLDILADKIKISTNKINEYKERKEKNK